MTNGGCTSAPTITGLAFWMVAISRQSKTSNQETRLRCLVCLARLSSPSSREMLGRLMERPDVSNSLRSAAELLQANGPAELPEIPSLDAPSAASFRGK